jgi:hypothetical protein
MNKIELLRTDNGWVLIVYSVSGVVIESSISPDLDSLLHHISEKYSNHDSSVRDVRVNTKYSEGV